MAPTQQSSVFAENNSEMATKTTSDMVHSIKKESHSSNSNSSISSASSNETNDRLLGSSLSSQEMLLPITTREHFFRDAFFRDARQHFEGAMTNVLDEWDRTSSMPDDLTNNSMLRKADLSENSQAVTVTEDSTCHKVVIDVHDFKDGGVSVKVVDEDQVVVEGSMEQQNGGSVSKKSFRRSFEFPGLVQGAGVASTLSADGILTITVPLSCLQVVLDVHDFLGGDIKVKVVGRSEVQVEGRIEKEEGGSVTVQSFHRSFHLPGVVDVDAVTSALSSDGVLTIKAPKGVSGASKGGC